MKRIKLLSLLTIIACIVFSTNDVINGFMDGYHETDDQTEYASTVHLRVKPTEAAVPDSLYCTATESRVPYHISSLDASADIHPSTGYEVVTVLSGLCAAMTKRSAYAQEVLGQILGYRDFLENVEIDKLRTLIDENPSYFYHNLSYAIVLDLEKEWAGKASDLVKEPATWYTGYGNPVLSSYFYYSMFNRINNRYRNCFAPPASAYRSSGRGPSHPGFSSFAGGGSGGGGARGW